LLPWLLHACLHPQGMNEAARPAVHIVITTEWCFSARSIAPAPQRPVLCWLATGKAYPALR
jgi:hypothetical protein